MQISGIMRDSLTPINEAQKLAFKEGWLAALQTLGVPEDPPLRNPNQIPFSGPPTTA